MNITDTLRQTRNEVQAEINRLQAVLVNLDVALGQSSSGQPGSPDSPRKRAPKGSLRDEILKVISASSAPLGPKEIHQKIASTGYKGYLTKLYVAKKLQAMNGVSVKRVGQGRTTKYLKK